MLVPFPRGGVAVGGWVLLAGSSTCANFCNRIRDTENREVASIVEKLVIPSHRPLFRPRSRVQYEICDLIKYRAVLTREGQKGDERGEEESTRTTAMIICIN